MILSMCVTHFALKHRYAVTADNITAATHIVRDINKTFWHDTKERVKRLTSRTPPNNEIMEVGIPGSCTALIGAMSFASCDMVQMLLRNGANPHETEVGGNNAFMCACAFNRLDNVKLWYVHIIHSSKSQTHTHTHTHSHTGSNISE